MPYSNKLLLMPVGVLAPGSAHAISSTQPPINMSTYRSAPEKCLREVLNFSQVCSLYLFWLVPYHIRGSKMWMALPT